MIWFMPFPGDWEDWVEAGATGWEHDTMDPYFDRLPAQHQIVAEKDRNAILLGLDHRGRARRAGVQADVDLNAAPFPDGVGFLDVGYDPENGMRSSSPCRLPPPDPRQRPNLTVSTETGRDAGRAARTAGPCRSTSERDGGGTTGRGPRDRPLRRRRRHAAAADAARASARRRLLDLGIDVAHDLPGVGENLIDHPESIIIWEPKRPMAPEAAMDADGALFVSRLGSDDRPDLMFHIYQIPFTFNTERLGYEVPEHGASA